MESEESVREEKIRILSDNEKELLFASISDMRDFILIRILYETGCSLQTVCKIRASDIEKERCLIKIFNEGNVIGRECFISNKLCANIRGYIKSNKLGSDDYLFETRQSEHMTAKRVAQIIEHYLNRIGIHDKTGKCIRYTHIVDAYKNKVSMDQIEKQIGIKKTRLVQICGGVKPEEGNPYDNFF